MKEPLLELSPVAYLSAPRVGKYKKVLSLISNLEMSRERAAVASATKSQVLGENDHVLVPEVIAPGMACRMWRNQPSLTEKVGG